MVNAPKQNASPLQPVKYGKSTMQSTRQRHQAKEGQSGMVAERVRALGALRSSQSNKKLSVEKRRETQFLTNDEKEKWIQDYVERETALARQLV